MRAMWDTSVSMRTDKIRLLALGLMLILLAGCGSVIPPLPGAPAPESAISDGLEPSPETVWGIETPEPIPEPVEPTAAPAPTPAPSPEPALEPSPAAGPTLSPSPEPDPVGNDEITAVLEQMTFTEKAAQLFVVTPEALTGTGGPVTAAGELTREAFDAIPVGGIVYMGDNLDSSAQTREMLSNMQSISMDRIGLPAFLCVDEEGGTVARISGSGRFDVPEYPDMIDVGNSGQTEWARQIGAEMGAYLSDLGFNVDFAPVADVLSNDSNTVVRYRSFGSDPQLVAEMTAAFSEGLAAEGVLAVYKHFPGHGNTAADSHAGFAESDADLDTLRQRELVPFRDGIARDVPFIMAGHISLPNVTGDGVPASLSRRILTDLIREEMGYEGIVITDALNMGAISDNYSAGVAAVMALEAGADMILMPADFQTAYDAVMEAIQNGTLSETRIDDSLRRILAVKLRLMA